jgi:hypothetical protein
MAGQTRKTMCLESADVFETRQFLKEEQAYKFVRTRTNFRKLPLIKATDDESSMNSAG